MAIQKVKLCNVIIGPQGAHMNSDQFSRAIFSKEIPFFPCVVIHSKPLAAPQPLKTSQEMVKCNLGHAWFMQEF